MNIVDLTHTFTDAMPVYPGDQQASVRQIAAIDTDGYADHFLSTGLHVGTHIDAPAHMIAGGKKIHELPPEFFCGKGVLIDARGKEVLDAKMLGQSGHASISDGTVVLFCTGWSSRFHTSEYFTGFPVMTEDVAEELVRRKIRMVGFDAPSPDRAPFSVHKILLGAGVLIIENLTNLEELLGVPQFEVRAFPVKIAADAALARVVAVF